MTKLKRSGVLMGILVAGLLVVKSFPAAGQQIQLLNYGTLRKDCLDSNITVSGCLVVAKAVSQLNAAVQSGSPDPILGPVEAEIRKALNLPGGASCFECKLAVSQFEALLNQNNTVRDIETQLKNGCAEQFPDPASQQQCDQFIDLFVPQIIDFVIKSLPPAKVCTDFGYCPAP